MSETGIYTINTELANKAFSHLLTMINTTETTTTPNTDPFVYNASTKSHYTSTVFIGIIIDIGASRKFTTGYGQFQTLQLTDPLV
jgi:hypothetical protein